MKRESWEVAPQVIIDRTAWEEFQRRCRARNERPAAVAGDVIKQWLDEGNWLDEE